MHYLSYHEKSDHESLKTFTKLIGSHHDNSQIYITKNLGNGTVQFISLDEGLYIRIWDCIFNKKIELHREPAKNHKQLFFTLAYYLTPQAIVLQNPTEKNMRVDQIWNTVFISNRADLRLNLLPDTRLRCFSICFTAQWIQNQTTHMPVKQKDFISTLCSTDQPVFYFETYDAFEEKMIHDIYEDDGMRKMGSLFLKSRVITLIHEFIQKSSERQSLLSPVHNNSYELIIRQVAAKLINSICDKLPSLQTLTQEFAISESTLSRNFKKIYGQTISKYYLDKKMEYAKRLVNEHQGTITEIAYTLGYEKVSQFIAMFKKHNGCLPGMLRKGAA
ncbi:MAG TPA: AraC family transcriptional regulator [Chitinophagaceae bacterium]|jgi:AraC-like DNA-binding protein|nr:AraC family transcriptional regulator [Chitinophagaceae bacterium]